MLSQSPGNKSVIPYPKIIPPERYVQKYCGTVIKIVENFRIKVKAIIDSASDPTTMYGVYTLRPCEAVPITTGNNGKMHGANTVRMPAKNETISNVTDNYLTCAVNATSVGEPLHLAIWFPLLST